MTTKKRPCFAPAFTITPTMANSLMRIEAARQAILTLPITPRVLANLRETARLHSTHYSTMIEGNRLTQEEVELVVKKMEHFPGRECDESEVNGYYAALSRLEQWVAQEHLITEKAIQTLHALVMNHGRQTVKATP